MERTAHDPIPGAPCKPSKIKAFRRFDSTFRIRFRVFDPWNLTENHGRWRKLPEAKKDRKSSVSRPLMGAWYSGRKGSKKIRFLSNLGEKFAFWRENRREKRENARQKIASAVGPKTNEVSSMLDEAILQETLKRYPKEISKEQLCKLCHISKRVAKYYLDNGVIPCRSNGQATHKYAIRTRDAITFLRRRDACRMPSASPSAAARSSRLSTPPSPTRSG